MEENEMSDLEIRQKYGNIIDEAVEAFAVDASYAADLAKKANEIMARRDRKTS